MTSSASTCGNSIQALVHLFAPYIFAAKYVQERHTGNLTRLNAQLEFWGGIKALPWVIKPVYGILSDAVPLLGYHRRSYLIIFGLLGQPTFCTVTPFLMLRLKHRDAVCRVESNMVLAGLQVGVHTSCPFHHIALDLQATLAHGAYQPLFVDAI